MLFKSLISLSSSSSSNNTTTISNESSSSFSTSLNSNCGTNKAFKGFFTRPSYEI